MLPIAALSPLMEVSADEVFQEITKEMVFMEEGKGGVTLSGGEPLMQPEFAKSILKLCKDAGIHTTIDTAGAVAFKHFTAILPFTDLFLYDIKLMDTKSHNKYTGISNQLILKNFKELVKKGKKVIARIPVIPTVNLNEQELKMMLDFFLPLKGENFNEIHLLPYHHIGQSKYSRFNKTDKMKGILEPEKKDLIPYGKMFEKAGFKVEIH